MKYMTTRGGETVSAERAIVQGLGADGGLFVPESFPQVTKYDLRDMAALNYNERAVRILERFLTGFSREQLRGMINAAYARFDDHGVAPLRELPGGVHVMELYHGPTLAFKDVALTLLPHLLTARCLSSWPPAAIPARRRCPSLPTCPARAARCSIPTAAYPRRSGCKWSRSAAITSRSWP